MRYRSVEMILVLAATALCMPASAQVQRSGGGELQKMMQQYQQVSAEKTVLQNQLQQAQTQLKDAQTELAAVKKERDSFKAKTGVSPAVVERLTASKETAEKGLEQYKARTAELVDKFRQVATSLKDTENDRAKLKRDLDDRNAQFDKCALNNLQLFELTNDVLDRYEHVGFFTKASASEPFTRITRTRIDNLVGEYRERAQELRTKARAP